ncbi:MAG: formylglycine-generating enzyme family protein [bacterium]|nr:formylglycine-generating enzyme family protein [bacterium]
MQQVIATDAEALRNAFIRAPEEPERWEEWRTWLVEWAARERTRLGPVLYDQTAQAWGSRAYAMGFLMLWDHELIDHETGEWKVDAVCARAAREFGGYDVVCLWSNYPLAGVDPRHQLAYYDELPGGHAGLRAAVARFHAHGVRVLVAYQPWIHGVPEGFRSAEEALVALVAECGLDGIYLDCSDGPSTPFRHALASQAGPDKIFVSEAPARLEPFGSEVASWLQMTDDSTAPGTYRNRWLDRHHLVYESRRYFYDPIRELQRAWMNGGGFVIWENVFGYWAEYSPRCKSWMRVLFPAQRRFADWFIHGKWLPHVGGGCMPGIYVSQWTWQDRTLWTVVNRRGHTIEKRLVRLPARADARYVDVISGQEYKVQAEGDHVYICGWLERDGMAGILAAEEGNEELEDFLASQRARFAEACWDAPPWRGEHRKTVLAHKLMPVKPTPRVSKVPAGMIRVPDYEGVMTTRYRMRECGYIAGVADELHVYDAFEQVCTYTRHVRVRDVAIDAFPVTNAEFYAFLEATGYRPTDPRNFLAHWEGGRPPLGKEHHPVVYVSLADARAYARWARKRLPREEEWQRAAQDVAMNEWPWGGPFDPAKCNGASSGTTPVDAYPAGRTPSGVWDLAGNVWEMTESERTDGHTRYFILKGGSWYQAQGSHWFFDGGARPGDWGAKHILLCDAWDRCATIGFRCVKDLR